MLLNLTEMEIPKATLPHPQELPLILEALSDDRRLDEVVFLISQYEPDEVIIDVDEDYLELIQEEFEDVTFILGRQDYDEYT